MRVIVFGATGKTGRHVLRSALDRGHEVTAFGRSVDRLEPESGLHVFRGDVFDPAAVSELLSPDPVTPGAAVAGFDPSRAQPNPTTTVGLKNDSCPHGRRVG